MATFPSIKTPHPSYCSKYPYKRQEKTPFQGGSVQTYAAHTSTTWFISIGWPEERALPNADYETLVSFFEANQGSVFDYTDPFTGYVYEMRFKEDQLPPAKQVGVTHQTLTGLEIFGKRKS